MASSHRVLTWKRKGRRRRERLLWIQSPLVLEATTLFFPSYLHYPIHLLENGLHFLPQLPLVSKLLTTTHCFLRRGWYSPPGCYSFAYIWASPKCLPSWNPSSQLHLLLWLFSLYLPGIFAFLPLFSLRAASLWVTLLFSPPSNTLWIRLWQSREGHEN